VLLVAALATLTLTMRGKFKHVYVEKKIAAHKDINIDALKSITELHLPDAIIPMETEDTDVNSKLLQKQGWTEVQRFKIEDDLMAVLKRGSEAITVNGKIGVKTCYEDCE